MTNKERLKTAEILTLVMDDQFSFLGIKFGIDPLLDFLPIAGSFVGLFISFYLVYVAWKIELESDKIAKMIRNVFIDFLIGEAPVVGIIGDIFYKSNRKNMEILRETV